MPASNTQQELLDLINSENRTVLKLDDITFSLPEPSTDIPIGKGRNTKITVTAKEDSFYTGQRVFYYNRLTPSRLGYMGIMSVEPLTAEQLLNMLSAEKGIELLASEFETLTVPVLEVGELGKITLKAKSTAIKWFGETDIELVFGLPPEVNLLHQFLHFTLPADDFLGGFGT